MIRSLRVINENYNFDLARPSTSYDIGETIEIARVDMALNKLKWGRRDLNPHPMLWRQLF